MLVPIEGNQNHDLADVGLNRVNTTSKSTNTASNLPTTHPSSAFDLLVFTQGLGAGLNVRSQGPEIEGPSP